jgi:transketolase
MIMTVQELRLRSVQYRKTILAIIRKSGAGHTGGSLSCIDILNVLYNRILNGSPQNFTDPGRDRYIQSKGHSVEALYTVLANKGFYPQTELDTLNRYQSHFVGHPTRKINGIEHNTGALGHGLSVAVGIAIAGKKSDSTYKVYALLGDGELTEGSNWEASMTAAHYQLDNLVVIVDRNGLQITGPTEDVIALEPLEDKFKAFGYAVKHVDGNNIADLVNIFAQIPFEPGRPSLILAHTVKGCGVSFMENKVNWHHKVPSDEEFALAMKELEAAEAQLLESLVAQPEMPQWS